MRQRKRRKSFNYVNQYVSKSSNSQSILHKVKIGEKHRFLQRFDSVLQQRRCVFQERTHIYLCNNTIR